MLKLERREKRERMTGERGRERGAWNAEAGEGGAEKYAGCRIHLCPPPN